MPELIKEFKKLIDTLEVITNAKTKLLEHRIASLEREIGIQVGNHSATLKALIEILKRDKKIELNEKLALCVPSSEHKNFTEIVSVYNSNLDRNWLQRWGRGRQLLDNDTIAVGRPIQQGTVVSRTGRGKRGIHLKKSKRRKSKKSKRRKSKKSKRRKSRRRK